VLYLNRANNTIAWSKISTGGMSATVVDIRVIFATALKVGAQAIILSHNHPGGQLKPSTQDLAMTKRIVEGGKILDINVLDHLIITDGGYLAFSDEGLV
jgi:DNA repair protein RadC